MLEKARAYDALCEEWSMMDKDWLDQPNWNVKHILEEKRMRGKRGDQRVLMKVLYSREKKA